MSFTTTVEFDVDAPVTGVGSEASPALDTLIDMWNGDPAVSSITVDWKALPRAGDELVGAAALRVDLRADKRATLRRIYNRLSMQIAREGTLKLIRRNCVLTDLFE